MSPIVRLALIAASTIGFFLPFFLFARKGEKAVETAKSARWGIVLQGLGFFAVYIHSPAFWNSPIAGWQVAASLFFAVLSWLLAWTAPRHLGRQWRIRRR